MRNIGLMILAFLPFTTMAQEATFPRDTSFTVYSSFIKEQKKFPFIRIANPPLSKAVVVDSNVVYKKIGNRQLHADIFYPKQHDKKGFPGVVLIHGGGWRSGDRSQTVPIAQELAARGYVTVAAEYRLSPEAVYPAGVLDIKALIKWLRGNAKKYHLDSRKIATMGFSSGGQMAALIGTTNGLQEFEEADPVNKHPATVQAIIDVDGILAFRHPESEEGAVAAAWLGGTYEQRPGVWSEASALSHIDKKTPPSLFINSSLPRFHAGRDDMIKKMQAYGTYSEVLTIPDTPHPFWFFEPWFKEVVDFSAGFLDKVFKAKSR